MKDRIYKSIVLISFLILLFVQLSLTYNTYVLKDRDYSLKEKKIINDEYGLSIADDKLYQGGGKIIDQLLSRNMISLEAAYRKNKGEFERLSRSVTDTLISQLRKKNTMDSIFRSIVAGKKLDKNLAYLLTFESIEIGFEKKGSPVFLFNVQENTVSNYTLARPYGFIIGGSLKRPTPENKITHLSVSGKLIYDYRVTFNLFVDAPGRPLRVLMQMLPTLLLVGLCILITVAINYYTYINWMRQKKASEIKSDFLNSIKHEFNTPITTILVASKSLEEEGVLNDKIRVKGLVKIVERQANRLHAHINQMLGITEITKNSVFEETDLNYLVLTIVNDYKIGLDDTSSLFFDPHQEEIILRLDTFVFTTMLLNIIDNSFKYNESEHKQTFLSIKACKEEYLLYIKDNGEGIEDSIQTKLFDKFFRGKRKGAQPGLGLGLYYVKQAISLHGWHIKIDSKLNEGTTFVVQIPKINP